MKKFHFVSAICVLLLGGCAHLIGLPPLDERTRPQVMVDKDGKLVAPQALYFLPRERDVEIVWQLPKDSRYRFHITPKGPTEEGIVIEGQVSDRVLRRTEGPNSVVLDRQNEIINCKVRSAFEFACLNKHSVPGVYKYTIRLVDPQNPNSAPLVRDPLVINM